MPTGNNANTAKGSNALQYIRTIYLSVAAAIGLICFIIGASGAIKLALNVWFPVDNTLYYSSPYDKSPCEITYVDGKEMPRPENEIAKCKMDMEQNAILQARSDFNRQLTESISITLVGFPVWLLHFWLMQADWRKRKYS